MLVNTGPALHWTPEGKRKLGRPKITWHRMVEGELKSLGHMWATVHGYRWQKTAPQWRAFVAALHDTMS